MFILQLFFIRHKHKLLSKMALEEPSEYLQGKWEHELKCFNCKTVMCVTQDDIIDYKFSTKARGNSFGVQCTCCKFPLELTEIYKDRKSTRLNSSHSQISYAVFCLKKKL